MNGGQRDAQALDSWATRLIRLDQWFFLAAVFALVAGSSRAYSQAPNAGPFSVAPSATPLPPPRAGSEFSNPPLKYFGPDPTHTQFVPGLNTTIATPPEQLGPVLFDSIPPPGTVVEEGSLVPDDWLLADGVVDVIETEPYRISDHKKGFFQKLSVTATWLDRGGTEDYGITEFDSFIAVALPLPTVEQPLVITPSFNLRLLDGPQQPNLPPQLYEAFVDFLWIPRVSPRWTGILGVAPMVRSDFQVEAKDALQLTGKGLVRYDWIPDRLQVLAGVLYLNREDIRILPVGGVLWKPNDDWNLELLYPRPKVARRVRNGGKFEDWVYVSGEFGGNSYDVEREPGVEDILTLFDIRVMLGVERKRDGGAGQRLEVGYVFQRSAEYFSGAPGSEPADTFLVRAGTAF